MTAGSNLPGGVSFVLFFNAFQPAEALEKQCAVPT
jgi:hypothetical protein